MGVARPHKVARRVHPDVKAPAKKPPAQPTGIDYLRLLETAQQAELGQAIRFDLLADIGTATSTDETSTQPTTEDASTDWAADDEPRT